MLEVRDDHEECQEANVGPPRADVALSAHQEEAIEAEGQLQLIAETPTAAPEASVASSLGVDGDDGGVWIFGYGSLIWRPSFPYADMRQGYVRGYKRRFWQGSTDHRGVPGSPGRVVTLIRVESNETITWGVAYYISKEHVNEVLSYLDYREKGGYTREIVDVFTKNTSHQATITGALLYRATEDNPEYLGRAPVAQIAAQIFKSRGPSGYNVEYLLNLVQTIRQMEVHDRHLFTLEQHILALMQQERIEWVSE